MQPLCVSCYAFNAIACDGALPLDGVLAEVWMREHHPEILYTNSVRAKDDLIEAELPILRIDQNHGWYYACSFVQVAWSNESISYWHKRSVAYEQTRYIGRGKINVAQGRDKAYRMPLFRILPATRLHWYLVGDREWIERRLPLVTGLGKKRAVGNGIVCDWRVEEIGHDYSVWGPDGRLMRAIPIEDIPLGCGAIFDIRESYAIRPPGWYPGNWARVAMPKMGYNE